MIWTGLDIWIVVTGALHAMACALLGNFLVLRRLSMMGDAISHAVLPGLAVGFLLTGSRENIPMFVGAAVAGVLTALFTQSINRIGRVDESASMGVVFTSLFAVGLILIVQAADSVDLDPGCVLYGAIELTPLDTIKVAGLDIPRAAITGMVSLGLNLAFVLLLYKELKISSFDPALATSAGFHADLIHYLLMIAVAATTVAAFESVGSILVIAMLIVPPAAAYLLTGRLGIMIVWSLVIAILAAAGGHVAAITVPGWFGYVDTTTAGGIGVVAGLLFAAVFLFAPRNGLVSRMVHRGLLSLRILEEDILGLLYRARESGSMPEPGLDRESVRSSLLAARPAFRFALGHLAMTRHVERTGTAMRLTEEGMQRARSLIRDHRLWESYLHDVADVATDHVHMTSEKLEHITDAVMRDELEAETRAPERDPQGKTIPRP